MRRRVTVMNEEYRCTPRSFRCMPLHSEHAGDTNETFLARFDARSTLRPYRLRAAPAASDKTASFPARGRTVPVHETAWILMGMPLPAANATKHSCATTAEVKILHWGTAQLEMPTP